MSAFTPILVAAGTAAPVVAVYVAFGPVQASMLVGLYALGTSGSRRQRPSQHSRHRYPYGDGLDGGDGGGGDGGSGDGGGGH